MYEYIIEPLTYKKTYIKSKKGKTILLNYLYNINKPTIQKSFSVKGGASAASAGSDLWLKGTYDSAHYSNLLLDNAYIMSMSLSSDDGEKDNGEKAKKSGPGSVSGIPIPPEFDSTPSTKNNMLIDPLFFKKHLIDNLSVEHDIHANYYMFDRDIAHDFKNKLSNNIFQSIIFPTNFLSQNFKARDNLIDDSKISKIECERTQNYVYVNGITNKLHYVQNNVRAYKSSDSEGKPIYPPGQNKCKLDASSSAGCSDKSEKCAAWHGNILSLPDLSLKNEKLPFITTDSMSGAGKFHITNTTWPNLFDSAGSKNLINELPESGSDHFTTFDTQNINDYTDYYDVFINSKWQQILIFTWHTKCGKIPFPNSFEDLKNMFSKRLLYTLYNEKESIQNFICFYIAINILRCLTIKLHDSTSTNKLVAEAFFFDEATNKNNYTIALYNKYFPNPIYEHFKTFFYDPSNKKNNLYGFNKFELPISQSEVCVCFLNKNTKFEPTLRNKKGENKKRLSLLEKIHTKLNNFTEYLFTNISGSDFNTLKGSFTRNDFRNITGMYYGLLLKYTSGDTTYIVSEIYNLIIFENEFSYTRTLDYMLATRLEMYKSNFICEINPKTSEIYVDLQEFLPVYVKNNKSNYNFFFNNEKNDCGLLTKINETISYDKDYTKLNDFNLTNYATINRYIYNNQQKINNINIYLGAELSNFINNIKDPTKFKNTIIDKGLDNFKSEIITKAKYLDHLKLVTWVNSKFIHETCTFTIDMVQEAEKLFYSAFENKKLTIQVEIPGDISNSNIWDNRNGTILNRTKDKITVKLDDSPESEEPKEYNLNQVVSFDSQPEPLENYIGDKWMEMVKEFYKNIYKDYEIIEFENNDILKNWLDIKDNIFFKNLRFEDIKDIEYFDLICKNKIIIENFIKICKFIKEIKPDEENDSIKIECNFKLEDLSNTINEINHKNMVLVVKNFIFNLKKLYDPRILKTKISQILFSPSIVAQGRENYGIGMEEVIDSLKRTTGNSKSAVKKQESLDKKLYNPTPEGQEPIDWPPVPNEQIKNLLDLYDKIIEYLTFFKQIFNFANSEEDTIVELKKKLIFIFKFGYIQFGSDTEEVTIGPGTGTAVKSKTYFRIEGWNKPNRGADPIDNPDYKSLQIGDNYNDMETRNRENTIIYFFYNLEKVIENAYDLEKCFMAYPDFKKKFKELKDEFGLFLKSINTEIENKIPDNHWELIMSNTPTPDILEGELDAFIKEYPSFKNIEKGGEHSLFFSIYNGISKYNLSLDDKSKRPIPGNLDEFEKEIEQKLRENFDRKYYDKKFWEDSAVIIAASTLYCINISVYFPKSHDSHDSFDDYIASNDILPDGNNKISHRDILPIKIKLVYIKPGIYVCELPEPTEPTEPPVSPEPTEPPVSPVSPAVSVMDVFMGGNYSFENLENKLWVKRKKKIQMGAAAPEEEDDPMENEEEEEDVRNYTEEIRELLRSDYNLNFFKDSEEILSHSTYLNSINIIYVLARELIMNIFDGKKINYKGSNLRRLIIEQARLNNLLENSCNKCGGWISIGWLSKERVGCNLCNDDAAIDASDARDRRGAEPLQITETLEYIEADNLANQHTKKGSFEFEPETVFLEVKPELSKIINKLKHMTDDDEFIDATPNDLLGMLTAHEIDILFKNQDQSLYIDFIKLIIKEKNILYKNKKIKQIDKEIEVNIEKIKIFYLLQIFKKAREEKNLKRGDTLLSRNATLRDEDSSEPWREGTPVPSDEITPVSSRAITPEPLVIETPNPSLMPSPVPSVIASTNLSHASTPLHPLIPSPDRSLMASPEPDSAGSQQDISMTDAEKNLQEKKGDLWNLEKKIDINNNTDIFPLILDRLKNSDDEIIRIFNNKMREFWSSIFIKIFTTDLNSISNLIEIINNCFKIYFFIYIRDTHRKDLLEEYNKELFFDMIYKFLSEIIEFYENNEFDHGIDDEELRLIQNTIISFYFPKSIEINIYFLYIINSKQYLIDKALNFEIMDTITLEKILKYDDEILEYQGIELNFEKLESKIAYLINKKDLIQRKDFHFPWFTELTSRDYGNEFDFYNQMTDSRKVEELESKFENCQGELANCQGELANCQGELANCQGELAICQRDLETRDQHLENCRLALVNCEGELAKCKGDLRIRTLDLSKCARARDECLKDLKARNQDLMNCHLELERRKRDVGGCQGELATCQEKLATCQGELATCQGELATCQGELATCQGELATCKQDLANCELAHQECLQNLGNCELAHQECERRLQLCELELSRYDDGRDVKRPWGKI